MDPFKINSLNDDEMWEIEDEYTGVKKGGAGGGKTDHKGPKTSKSEKDSQSENTAEKNKKKAEVILVRELNHFPFKNHGKERIDEAVHDYSDWVLKSLLEGKPYLENFEEGFKYSPSRASGPGGQNVNKNSNAVMVKHLMTGMFSRSEDSTETLENKKRSSSKLYKNLTNHIENWRLFLGLNLDKEKRKEEIKIYTKELSEKIKTFMQNLSDEKVK